MEGRKGSYSSYSPGDMSGQVEELEYIPKCGGWKRPFSCND